ncbi:hypothetical protein DID77_04550 [Candidatus Marinamargulisbacteria bacterium SCGC AG-439-L15]|nr:hypothetical protein DID77_04550 [Candidatus Marinamargulisbacteria bacterium SCGC AG-439-L15]
MWTYIKLSILPLLLSVSTCFGIDHYEIHTVKKTIPLTVQTTTTIEGVLIHEKSPQHQQWFYCNKDYAVYKWIYENPSENTKLKAIKKSETIHVSGTYYGTPLEKTVKTNAMPWFQNIDYAIAQSQKKHTLPLSFLYFRPKRMSLDTMILKKNQSDKTGRNFIVTFANYKSFFWKVYYKLDQNNKMIDKHIKMSPKVSTKHIKTEGK